MNSALRDDLFDDQYNMSLCEGFFRSVGMEKHWLITEGFGAFITAVSQSEEFKSSLEQVYRAYRDVGYQSGLKDGYLYSAQGLDRKETPLYNSKAKKRMSKLEKGVWGKTPTLFEKILKHPVISIDELKALLAPVGPSSPKSLSGGDSQCSYPGLVGDPWLFVAFLGKNQYSFIHRKFFLSGVSSVRGQSLDKFIMLDYVFFGLFVHFLWVR
ncbi:hypothetical protein Hanom_Chr03g00203891 [Helianthus anomalus]